MTSCELIPGDVNLYIYCRFVVVHSCYWGNILLQASVCETELPSAIERTFYEVSTCQPRRHCPPIYVLGDELYGYALAGTLESTLMRSSWSLWGTVRYYILYIIPGWLERPWKSNHHEVHRRFLRKKFCIDFETSVIFGLSFGSSAQHVLMKLHS